MYLRRSTYVFALIGISMIIYVFQYVDKQYRKTASMTAAAAEKSNRFYNSSVEGFSLRSKRLNDARHRNIGKYQSDTCAHLKKPSQGDIRIRHTYWQVQQDGQEDIVVYSAFYDNRPIVGVLPWIRILGVRRLSRKPLWCFVWFTGNDKPFIIEAEVVRTGRTIPISSQHVYTQNMFSCPLDGAVQTPMQVSIATQTCAVLSTLLPVTTPIKSDERSQNFAACLRVNSGYFPAEKIVEWMETHSMFGLTRVNIYNSSLDNKLDRVFDYYIRKGFLELRQIPSPFEVPAKKAMTLANSASLNDCMLRNMYSHRFVVIVDFDEIVVPRIHNNYLEMFHHLDSLYRRPNSHHTYSFQNAYCFQNFAEDRTQPIFLRTTRQRYCATTSVSILGPKSFLDPRKCKSIFNQRCWTRVNKMDSTTIVVNASVALCHNYRSVCPFSRFRCEQYNRGKIQDNIMLKYKEVLLRRMAAALKAIADGLV